MYDAIDKRDVFLSHSSTDASAAGDLVRRLEATGVSCWIAPRDVRPGRTYAAALYYALEAAPVFVVLMSAAANRSDHVERELEIANQTKKRIVPVQLERFEATGAFCYYTRAMHAYSWLKDPDLTVTRIVEQVTRAKQTSWLDRVRCGGRVRVEQHSR
jgi:hypothetical protein